MGRPLKGKAPRDRVLQVRLTAAEHEGLKKLAKKRGVSMADLLMESFRKEK